MLLLPHCLHLSAYCTSFFTSCSFHTRKPPPPPPLPPVQGLRGLDAFSSEPTSFAPFHLSSRGSNSSRSVNLNTQTAVMKTIKLTGVITERRWAGPGPAARRPLAGSSLPRKPTPPTRRHGGNIIVPSPSARIICRRCAAASHRRHWGGFDCGTLGGQGQGHVYVYSTFGDKLE